MRLGDSGQVIPASARSRRRRYQILAIPGHGAQPTEVDLERVGELCLRSTKRSAFSGQTVTFIGLNNAGYHNNIFRPLSRAWEEFTGATIQWIDVPQEEMYSKVQQGVATGEIEFDVMEGAAPWEGDILGRDLANRHAGLGQGASRSQ